MNTECEVGICRVVESERMHGNERARKTKKVWPPWLA